MTGIGGPALVDEQRPFERALGALLCCSSAGVVVVGVVLPCASTTPAHASTIARAMVSTRTILLMRATPLVERGGVPKASPRCTTPATIATLDESAMNFVLFRPIILANFVELRHGEVRRIPIPRTWVNKALARPKRQTFTAQKCQSP